MIIAERKIKDSVGVAVARCLCVPIFRHLRVTLHTFSNVKTIADECLVFGLPAFGGLKCVFECFLPCVRLHFFLKRSLFFLSIFSVAY